MKSFEHLFYPGDSSEGIAKKNELIREPVVLPYFPGTQPSWRITWERLWNHIRTSQAQTVERMRQMPVDADSAERFAHTQCIQPAEGFVDFTIAQLKSNFSDYDPHNGFDLDLFLYVYLDLQNGFATTRILTEIFPRPLFGVAVTAYKSGIKLPEQQWIQPPDDHTLMGLLFKERAGGGADPKALYRRFSTFRGKWEIKSEESIDIFLSRLCFSILTPHVVGTVEVFKAGTRHVEDKPFKAMFERIKV